MGSDFANFGITNEFLEEAAKLKWSAEYKGDIKVKTFTIDKGCNVGDGNTTVVLKVIPSIFNA